MLTLDRKPLVIPDLIGDLTVAIQIKIPPFAAGK
jgi:hypothetical protein